MGKFNQFLPFESPALAFLAASERSKREGTKRYNFGAKRSNREEVLKDNKKQEEIVLQNRAAGNKKRYKKIYDLFSRRGGAAWYEALTGMTLDEDRIYYDIGYFQDVLQTGVTLEDLKDGETRDPEKLQNKIKRERLAVMSSYRSKKQAYTERYLMIYWGTPKWADLDKMQEFYKERDRLILETGISHEVDHIIPIIHKKVCGLNNEFNLRVIPKDENRAKSNKYDIDA